MAKSIRFSGHSYRRMLGRGAVEDEVIETIRTARWAQAERGRQECGKDFAYGREWNGKVYATKRVRPIFVEEQHEILVVTVYVYYF